MPRTETSSIPPKITPPPAPAGIIGVVTGLGILAACVVLYFFNPSKYGFYPVCEFHELTGLNCPGCGGTRSAYELLHGHLLAALHDNALFVLSLVVLTVRWGGMAVQKMRNRPVPDFLPPPLLWAFLTVAIVFTVLRNLPAFSFLAP